MQRQVQLGAQRVCVGELPRVEIAHADRAHERRDPGLKALRGAAFATHSSICCQGLG